jgi:hypothetical protein
MPGDENQPGFLRLEITLNCLLLKKKHEVPHTQYSAMKNYN